MDPVAIRGAVGDRATVVTYLRGRRKRSRNVKGAYNGIKSAQEEIGFKKGHPPSTLNKI